MHNLRPSLRFRTNSTVRPSSGHCPRRYRKKLWWIGLGEERRSNSLNFSWSFAALIDEIASRNERTWRLFLIKGFFSSPPSVPNSTPSLRPQRRRWRSDSRSSLILMRWDTFSEGSEERNKWGGWIWKTDQWSILFNFTRDKVNIFGTGTELTYFIQSLFFYKIIPYIGMNFSNIMRIIPGQIPRLHLRQSPLGHSDCLREPDRIQWMRSHREDGWGDRDSWDPGDAWDYRPDRLIYVRCYCAFLNNVSVIVEINMMCRIMYHSYFSDQRNKFIYCYANNGALYISGKV